MQRRRLLSQKDIDYINDTVRDLRQEFGVRHAFYLVLEDREGSSSNPMDSVFGEAVDPFSVVDAVEVTTTKVAFEAQIINEDESSEYSTAGFLDTKNLLVEASMNTVARQKIDWKPGLLVEVDSERFRVLECTTRGLVNKNRVVLNLEKVT